MSGQDAAVLILGGSGQVGTALTRRHWPSGMQVHAPSHRDLEITSETSIAGTLSARRWTCVINCAAYTAVDAAESDAEIAWFANAKGPLGAEPVSSPCTLAAPVFSSSRSDVGLQRLMLDDHFGTVRAEIGMLQGLPSAAVPRATELRCSVRTRRNV